MAILIMVNEWIDFIIADASLFIGVGLAGGVRNKHFSSTG